MVEKPLDYMPGHIIYNEKDFETFLKDICQNLDPYRNERKNLKDRIHRFQDGNSTERILKEIGLLEK